MKFGEFIKEKILLIFLVLFIIASSEILLLPYPQIEISSKYALFKKREEPFTSKFPN